jgi:hypothetical protein
VSSDVTMILMLIAFLIICVVAVKFIIRRMNDDTGRPEAKWEKVLKHIISFFSSGA